MAMESGLRWDAQITAGDRWNGKGSKWEVESVNLTTGTDLWRNKVEAPLREDRYVFGTV